MNLTNEIKTYIEENLLTDNTVLWDMSTDIIASGLLDSLSIVKLMVFIEDHYNISIDDAEDLEQFKTLGTIAALVENKLNKS